MIQNLFLENEKLRLENATLRRRIEELEEILDGRARTYRADAGIEGWEKFWEAYPLKINKSKAMGQWAYLKPNEVTVEEILAGITKCKKLGIWVKGREKFIPYPDKYLRDRRWEDEFVKPDKNPMIIWQEILNCCKKGITNYEPNNEQIQKAIRACGGMTQIGLSSFEKLYFLRKLFIENYNG